MVTITVDDCAVSSQPSINHFTSAGRADTAQSSTGMGTVSFNSPSSCRYNKQGSTCDCCIFIPLSSMVTSIRVLKNFIAASAFPYIDLASFITIFFRFSSMMNPQITIARCGSINSSFPMSESKKAASILQFSIVHPFFFF